MIFGHFLGSKKAEIGDFGLKVPSNLPVVGLFKFGHVRFFGDSGQISGDVFFAFPENCLRGPYEACENGPEPKNSHFGDLVAPNLRVTGLFKFGQLRFSGDYT